MTSYDLGSHLESFIAAQVASGRFANASEVMSAALRVLEVEVEQTEYDNLSEVDYAQLLRGKIQNAVDSCKIDGNAAMAGLHARIAERNGEKSVHEAA